MKALVIRTSGAEETVELSTKNWIHEIDEIINCTYTDTVNLRDGRLMFVDDNGYEVRPVSRKVHGINTVELQTVRALKPVNEKATALYHAVYRPGTTHQIIGDVVIVNDADFGDAD